MASSSALSQPIASSCPPVRFPCPGLRHIRRLSYDAHVQPGIVKAPTAVFQFDPELGL